MANEESGGGGVSGIPAAGHSESRLDRVVAALTRLGCAPTRSGGQWKSRCPAHDDREPSLSIGEGDDGRVLLYCHAGCDVTQITQAIGLTPSDLFPASPHRSSSTPFEIRDPSGKLVATHVRRDCPEGGKRFAWVSPDGSRGLRGDPVSSLPLFGSERVSAHPAEEMILIVEGEKATEALLAAGFLALGTVTGANGCPASDVLKVVAGHPVTLWPDADEVGRCHMGRIARQLLAIGVDVRVFTWAEANEREDAYDYFVRGLPAAQLRSDLLSARPAADWLPEFDSPSKQDARAAASNGDGSRAVVTLLSDVQSQIVEWLWEARIPLGMLTILDGDPGLGKSTILLDLAARNSRGDPMPGFDQRREPGGTVLLTAEDDIARVVRPRLDAAGADLSRIATVGVRDESGTREPSISAEDLVEVEKAIRQVEARLVIVDPLMAFLPTEVNANRDQDVRRALARLRDLAERTGAAVLVVRHLNKAMGGPALYRGGGSIGIIGAARSGLLLAADPAAPEESRVLAVVKSNLAQKPRSLRLQLVQEMGHDFPRVAWGESCDLSPAQLLAPAEKAERRSARVEAVEFIREFLAEGRVPAKDVESAALEAGISGKTLQRAREDLGVISEKVGRPTTDGQQWLWRLPTDPESEGRPKQATSRDRDHLRAGDVDDRDEVHASSKMATVVPKAATGTDDDPLRQGELVSSQEISTGRTWLTEGPKVVSPEADHVRENRPNSEIQCEEGQVHAHDPLRRPVSTSPTTAGVDACPSCGGRTLQWGSATICTRCHERVPSEGAELGSAMRTAPE